MGEGYTAWVAYVEKIPATYAIPAALLTVALLLWIWNLFDARHLQKRLVGLKVTGGNHSEPSPIRAPHIMETSRDNRTFSYELPVIHVYVAGNGRNRIEASTKLAVLALRNIADRLEGGDAELVEEEVGMFTESMVVRYRVKL